MDESKTYYCPASAAERAEVGAFSQIAVRLFVRVLALAFCTPLLAQSTGKTVRHHTVVETDNSSSPELTAAETAIEKKDYATAESLLKKVVDHEPGNYTAWFDLGFALNASGKTGDAIAAYRRSVEAKPDVFESNLNLGLMLAKTHQPEAEKFLRVAARLKPTSQVDEGRERAWLSLAHVLENSQPQQALDAYREAATLQPKDPEPHIAAGLLRERMNDWQGAAAEYQAVLALDPQSVEALTGLANIYMHEKRMPEAEAILRKLAAARPEDAGVHLQLGRMLAAASKNDEATVEIQAGLKLAPGDIDGQRDLAEVLSNAGKYDQAEPVYRSLLKAKPNDPELHYGFGKILLKQHKYGEAQEQFFAAVDLKPDFGDAYGELAVAADENKNYEVAIRALDARAKYLPEIPVSYFLRATAYDHLRAYKQAAENYHRFLEVSDGKLPDQEWQARHRLIAIEPKKK